MAGYCGKEWEGFVAEVKKSRVKDEASEDDANHFFLGLQKLVEKKTRLFWHREFFQQYIENKIVPWA